MNRRLQMIRERNLGAPLRRGVHVLPNLITTCGLFSGFYSIISSLRGDFQAAAVAVLVAQLFDILDGRVARVTRTTTDFGVEYDSLSDLVAFGVAPGILVYEWALHPWGTWGWLAAALYVTCGALRLARFNVQYDNVERRHFTGLPIPAAADVICTTVLLYFYLGGAGSTSKHVALLLVTYALAGLMVSNVRYYSFKDVNLHRRQPFWMLVALVLLANFVIGEPQVVLFAGANGYAAYGLVRWVYLRGRRRQRRKSSPTDVESDVLTRSA